MNRKKRNDIKQPYCFTKNQKQLARCQISKKHANFHGELSLKRTQVNISRRRCFSDNNFFIRTHQISQENHNVLEHVQIFHERTDQNYVSLYLTRTHQGFPGEEILPEKRLNTIPIFAVYGLRMPIYGSNVFQYGKILSKLFLIKFHGVKDTLSVKKVGKID